MSRTLLPALPIVEVLPELLAALADHPAVVLEAPPGAGKSTVVPLALLEAPWRADRRILMLEPRRLATRAVALRMAETLGETVGMTVGYRMRFDRQVSAATRIEVITEGLLTRLLQDDPALEAVAAILFDEFHERSLHADLGLALALEAQRTLAPHVRILVMSATLDGAAVARLLGTPESPAPRITSAGRSFPVTTHYAPRAPEDPLREVTAKILEVLAPSAAAAGDVLVFLPGAPEIRRVMRALQERGLPPGTDLRPLFGDLPAAEQDLAVRASQPGRRKVVLATSIAETSLTLDGVTVVIDSGLARSARFDPASGMSRLTTTRVSRAAADQRQGRAGRTRAGECHRLWTADAHRTLTGAAAPELLEADLAPLALELACWGVRDAGTLALLDAPPVAGLAQARDVLQRLGAIDASGRVTPHGRAMARLGVHPRLAHMMLRGREWGHGPLAADLAALLAERDVLARSGQRDADLRTRLRWLERSGEGIPPQADAQALRTARQLARQFRRLLHVDEQDRGADANLAAGLLVALAYPDRVAQRRGGEIDGSQVGGRAARFLLAQGRGAQLPAGEPLGREPWLAVAQLDGGRTAQEAEPDITLAVPLDPAVFDGPLASEVHAGLRVLWDAREEAVIARRERSFGALVLHSRDARDADPERVRAALLEGLRGLGAQALPWTRSAETLRERMAFVGQVLRTGPLHQRSGVLESAHWPDCMLDALMDSLEQWLAPWLEGVTRRSHLARVDVHGALLARLDGPQQRALDELAPTHFVVPSGSRIPIDYADPAAPALQVRLQEVFGLKATPRLGGGRVPLVLHLLSPAQRPVQVTRDLESFWSRGYAEVRKELKGRYPKHYWPDDPHTAVATHRAKPRP